MHQLQICPTVHKYRAPPTIVANYIRVCAVVWECGRGQTDIQTDRLSDAQTRVTTIHFASSTTRAKCNDNFTAEESQSTCQHLPESWETWALARCRDSEHSRSYDPACVVRRPCTAAAPVGPSSPAVASHAPQRTEHSPVITYQLLHSTANSTTILCLSVSVAGSLLGTRPNLD